jgi:hypothetical protein
MCGIMSRCVVKSPEENLNCKFVMEVGSSRGGGGEAILHSGGFLWEAHQ